VVAHGFEFLCGGGQGGLDRGDLAEPALFSGLPEPVAEVGADLFQPRYLGRVDAEEGASDTGIFMRAWGPEVAAAGPQGNFPQLEAKLADADLRLAVDLLKRGTYIGTTEKRLYALIAATARER
jgi:hypothetical protein